MGEEGQMDERREGGREGGRGFFVYLLHSVEGLIAAFGAHGDDHDAADLWTGGREGEREGRREGGREGGRVRGLL